jgi:uncharacterized protein YegL
MRRLPVYLVLDTSGSMSGEPIQAVENGMQMLVSALRQDPHALESAFLSVITFDSNAKQVVPLTDLASFQMPALNAGGSTELGAALTLVRDRARSEVAKSTPEKKGDWRPLVFLMTDGGPTDSWQKGLQEFHSSKWGMVVCCAAGQGADTNVLKQISPECVVQLDTADSKSLAAFFKWVSASISSSSKSVNEGKKEVTGMDQLPPPPPEISIV